MISTVRDSNSEASNTKDQESLRVGIGRRLWLGAVSPLIFLAIAVIYTLWLGGAFLNSDTRLLDVHQNAPVFLVALGLCVCLIAGQFDLSVGSMATLSVFLCLGFTAKQGLPFWVSIVLCLVIGVLVGLLNALLVLRFRVNAFIATLATGGILIGLSHVYSGGSAFTPSPSDIGQIPDWFAGPGSIGSFQTRVPTVLTWLMITALVSALGVVLLESTRPAHQRTMRYVVLAGASVVSAAAAVVILASGFSLPVTVFIVLTVTLILWIMLRYTVTGRELYAVGGNALAARLAGVNVNRRTTLAFVVSSTVASFAGIMLAANQGSASPDIAVPYLLPAFAAVFLSTVMFSSGRFHVWGTLLGGYVLVLVSQGLIVGGVPFTWTDVINGVVLAGAVAFSTALRRTS